ncbi:site-2 protease family protein [Kribbella sp. WER1]
MKETFRFGRIAGIPIGTHWSVLGMVLIITGTLAWTTLPYLVPGRSAAEYWITGVIVAVVFVASLLVHELAHALTALRFRVPVQRITLWMLGGVSVLDGDPETPRGAFLIAAAGPAASLALGGLGIGGGLLLGASEHGGLPEMSVMWLAVMNLALFVFNLLPGVPLDGGRVLRAVLWHRYGDPDKATVIASVAGVCVGTLVALAGVAELITKDPGGLWLLAVGYVIGLAATMERRQARQRAVSTPTD